MSGFWKYFVFVALFFWSGFIFGQKSYDPGYIVTNKSDTIFGFVNDRKTGPFEKLYKKIRFKERKKQIYAKKYSANKILGYKQAARIYESLWIDESSNFFDKNYYSVPGMGAKKFLKVNVSGFVSYYELEYEDPESGYINSINLYKKQGDSNLMQISQGIFGLKKKNLAKFFSDCPELVKKIENKEIKSAFEIAEFYNNFRKTNK